MDYLDRELIESGELKRKVKEDGIRGITSNPKTFSEAVMGSYEQAAWAYIQGLEERVEKGEPIDHIASVASFFLSRINVKVDQRIDERLKTIGTENLNEEARLQELKGTVAIANAKVAYQKFKEILSCDRWKALEAKGARVQRVLWASTSTKNPDYSDVMYVNALVGPNTINTLPPKTIEATLDHAHPGPNRVVPPLSPLPPIWPGLTPCWRCSTCYLDFPWTADGCFAPLSGE
jgi:transaldolase